MEKLRFLLLPLLALTFVPFSMAQDSDEDVEEVVVTGSRITNPNIVSTSQVQVVTAEDIDNRGAVRIEEVLNDLPQKKTPGYYYSGYYGYGYFRYKYYNKYYGRDEKESKVS